MRKTSLFLLALALCRPAAALAQDTPSGGEAEAAPEEAEKAREPRPPKPITREHFEKVVREMFAEADTKHDGMLTLGEFQTLMQSRRAAVINARFARIDTDHNGSISSEEFMAWQLQMGSIASRETGAFGDNAGPVTEVIMPRAGGDATDLMLAGLIEPLSETVIAAANTNYDAGTSLAELLAYEDKRFDAADTDHDGWLTMQELQASTRRGARDAGARPPGAGPPR